jgi:hypothetical protein
VKLRHAEWKKHVRRADMSRQQQQCL